MTGLYIKEIGWSGHHINIVDFERSIILAFKKEDSEWAPAVDCVYDKSPKKKFAFIKKYNNKPEYKLIVKRNKDCFGRYYKLVEAEYEKEHLILEEVEK